MHTAAPHLVALVRAGAKFVKGVMSDDGTNINGVLASDGGLASDLSRVAIEFRHPTALDQYH